MNGWVLLLLIVVSLSSALTQIPLLISNSQFFCIYSIHYESVYIGCTLLCQLSFTFGSEYSNTVVHMKWKTNRCHYFNFIHISTDLYMFRAYRPILRRIHTAVHTTIGSVAVLFGPRTLYRARGPNGTATEPMVVWTAVWILLRMGL
jgi:hypothetical protein